MVFVCEELCNMSFEKQSLNQDNNNYRTKTLNRSVHYPSLHCRTIHHRWEFFLYVSCRGEKKKNTIIVTFPAEMMKNEGPVQQLQRGLFLGPLHRWQNIFFCIHFLNISFAFHHLQIWFFSPAIILINTFNLFLNYYSCLSFFGLYIF